MPVIYRGPRPYSELDEKNFFGRDREIGDLFDLIERNRLSIVTAPSGVGKTSVLLAGVIPRLRRAHEEELMGGETLLGPTLVCRNWSGSTRRPPHRVLLNAINVAVRDLSEGETLFLKPEDQGNVDKLKREAEALRELLDPYLANDRGKADWLELMTRYADKFQRLVLIFDQFEDVLRLPAPGTQNILRAISNLFSQEPRVRVLLSFRQEYVMSLHDLEAAVGGLGKRTYFLQAIRSAAIDEIVIRPAANNNITVENGVVKRLQAWLDQSQATQDQATDDFTSTAYDGSNESDGSTTVPLLALQALLVDVYEIIVEGSHKSEITLDDLTQYETKRNVQPKHIAQRALETHIDKVIVQSSDGEFAAALSRVARGTSPEEKNLLLRRLFARMPSQLTAGSRPGSPGYKRQIGFKKMMEEVLRDDFEALDVNLAATQATQADDLLRFLKDAGNLGIDFKKSTKPGPDENPRSGIARRPGWSNARATQVLIAALGELLRRLVTGNVLKPLGSDGESAYELVHDGLGPAVQTWAERFQSSPDNALAAITRLNGVTFRWPRGPAVPANATIENAFWSGCVVSNQEFHGVTFKNCKLNGTMFQDCTFRGSAFEGCDLDGAIFMDSKFFSMTHGEEVTPHRFEGGWMQSALFRGCEFHDARVQDVALNGSVFIKTDVFGKLVIEKSSLEVVVFRDCDLKNGKADPARDTGIFISNCDFVFSRVIAGKAAQTTVYLDDTSNLLFPEEPRLFMTDPGHRHWTPPPS